MDICEQNHFQRSFPKLAQQDHYTPLEAIEASLLIEEKSGAPKALPKLWKQASISCETLFYQMTDEHINSLKTKAVQDTNLEGMELDYVIPLMGDEPIPI